MTKTAVDKLFEEFKKEEYQLHSKKFKKGVLSAGLSTGSVVQIVASSTKGTIYDFLTNKLIPQEYYRFETDSFIQAIQWRKRIITLLKD